MALEPQVYNTLNGVTGGVWRDGDVVIKHLRHTAPPSPGWEPSTSRRDWNYWRREAFAYETDLPGRLGLRAPELLTSTDTADGVELRIAALGGRTADSLELADLEELATRLGAAQGAVEQPSDPWLSRGFLRDYATTRPADYTLLDHDEAWLQPLVEPYVDDALRDDLRWLHDNRIRLHAISLALPRAVCHLDVFPNNVFADAGGVALIDWAFTGDGALGEDVGNLVPDSVFDLQVAVGALPELEEKLVSGYLRGLRAAGWHGDDRVVLLGIHSSAVKYDWLASRMLARAGDASQSRYGGEQADAAALFSARWEGLRLVARWARSAVAAADALRL